LEGDGVQTPINADAANPPSLQSTWFITLVVALIRKLFERGTQASETTQAGESEDGEIATGTDSDKPELEYPDQEPNSSDGVNSGKIGLVAVKSGGRRRKAARKR
jgi:hypothetical protein